MLRVNYSQSYFQVHGRLRIECQSEINPAIYGVQRNRILNVIVPATIKVQIAYLLWKRRNVDKKEGKISNKNLGYGERGRKKKTDNMILKFSISKIIESLNDSISISIITLLIEVYTSCVKIAKSWCLMDERSLCCK